MRSCRTSAAATTSSPPTSPPATGSAWPSTSSQQPSERLVDSVTAPSHADRSASAKLPLIALADGYRESAESWADLLRARARRGVRAPVLAAGVGALGFWSALREVFPQTAEQRCWFHKSANVLAALPKLDGQCRARRAGGAQSQSRPRH